MDKYMRDIGVEERGEGTFVYAGDVAVALDNAVDLQNIVDAWNLAMTQNGMKMNTALRKTEFMQVRRQMEDFDISMGDQ